MLAACSHSQVSAGWCIIIIIRKDFFSLDPNLIFGDRWTHSLFHKRRKKNKSLCIMNAVIYGCTHVKSRSTGFVVLFFFNSFNLNNNRIQRQTWNLQIKWESGAFFWCESIIWLYPCEISGRLAKCLRLSHLHSLRVCSVSHTEDR